VDCTFCAGTTVRKKGSPSGDERFLVEGGDELIDDGLFELVGGEAVGVAGGAPVALACEADVGCPCAPFPVAVTDPPCGELLAADLHRPEGVL
jgi:hypothetical protein